MHTGTWGQVLWPVWIGVRSSKLKGLGEACRAAKPPAGRQGERGRRGGGEVRGGVRPRKACRLVSLTRSPRIRRCCSAGRRRTLGQGPSATKCWRQKTARGGGRHFRVWDCRGGAGDRSCCPVRGVPCVSSPQRLCANRGYNCAPRGCGRSTWPAGQCLPAARPPRGALILHWCCQAPRPTASASTRSLQAARMGRPVTRTSVLICHAHLPLCPPVPAWQRPASRGHSSLPTLTVEQVHTAAGPVRHPQAHIAGSRDVAEEAGSADANAVIVDQPNHSDRGPSVERSVVAPHSLLRHAVRALGGCHVVLCGGGRGGTAV